MEKTTQRVLIILAVLIIIRIIAMIVIPLNDTTEARYAEIARKMLETDNWVTLWHDYGIPFWAKPPLSTWLSAASMKYLGVNAFAVRLPALILAALTCGLTFAVARKRMGEAPAWIATLVLASGVLFYLSAGTVMTDPSLMFCVALGQIAFWRAMREPGRLWAYLFFVALGLGLLAKGPLTIVLVGMPIFIWLWVQHEWMKMWRTLPWFGGIILMLLIGVPWYLMAEIRTPGFLDYFIMGEHVHRFLDAGWKGDKYGFAHATPRGMIWPFAFAALLPWTPVLLYWLARRRPPEQNQPQDGWLLYLALWTVMPLLFFTLSGNIIFPYSLPMTPGFALLFAELWRRRGQTGRALSWLGLFSGMVTLIAIALFSMAPEKIGRTQADLIHAWKADHPAANSHLLFWDTRREFSAEFYSGGRARTSTDPKQALALLNDSTRDYIAVPQDQYSTLPLVVQQHFAQIAEYRHPGEQMLLLRKRRETD